MWSLTRWATRGVLPRYFLLLFDEPKRLLTLASALNALLPDISWFIPSFRPLKGFPCPPRVKQLPLLSALCAPALVYFFIALLLIYRLFLPSTTVMCFVSFYLKCLPTSQALST